MNTTEELLNNRGKVYGNFSDNSEIARALLAAINRGEQIRGYRKMSPLESHQYNALVMICEKISRILCGDSCYPDNWDDIAGYAQLGKEPR